MDTLNTQQQRAVEAGDGPLIIVAGPGTGKTKTLTARISYLISSGRAKPGDILALTFTKKAAQEMAERVGNPEVTLCTFHALCQRLLGGEHAFVMEPERLAIVKSLPRPAELKGVSVRELGLLISRVKNKVKESADVAKIAAAYTAELERRGLCDFDDLLLKARKLLQEEPAKRPSYRYILVDEFQDTNALQYEILQLIRGNDNVFVIGDPNQSIYAFRGASGTIFEQFERDFPDAARITLTTNYRSSPEVVAVSNVVFPGTAELRARSNVAGQVRAVEVLNEYSEANWVVSEIQRAVGGADMLQGSVDEAHHSLRDFAILYRNRKTATVVQKYIAESGLPFQIVGEGSPYERADIQELIGMLRAAHEQNVAKASPAAAAQRLAEQAGLDSKEVHQFLSTLVRFATLPEALTHLDRIAEDHFYDPAAEAVTLLTIHASKGLEFSRVFIVGVEEGTLPHKKADEQEERRLFYVAVTRAKEQLDILHARRRAGENATVSRFVGELPPSLLPRLTDPQLATDQRRAQKRHAKRAQISLF
ncbi:MAG TPA: ATP-dependent helicase [Candidatus Saccharimonadales bacterium]|nr:ATP-dependent helicase [Candidatus Saccharimonadales bacterium]